MSKNTIELKLPSRLDSIEKAVAESTEFASASGFPVEELFSIDMAVRESVANAIKHGNKFDESKAVLITLLKKDDALEITVRDFGDGFAVEKVPDPTDAENLLKDSGRGILFMNNFMDEVEWINHSEGGTIVKMTKKL